MQIYILAHLTRYNALNDERRSSRRLNLQRKPFVRSDAKGTIAG
jgi:hypothetical protein